MRTISIAIGIALLVLVPSAAMAQGEGAIVSRDKSDWVIAWAEFDGVHTWVISSTYPDFGCGDAASKPDSWQLVVTPVGGQHYRETGRLFSRVYYATLEDVEAVGIEAFVCEHPYVAEGILSFLWYDNQQDATAPGANVWGHVLNGTLTDIAGACKSQMVKVDVLHLWRIAPHADLPACLPGCVTVRVWKGPTAECVK